MRRKDIAEGIVHVLCLFGLYGLVSASVDLFGYGNPWPGVVFLVGFLAYIYAAVELFER